MMNHHWSFNLIRDMKNSSNHIIRTEKAVVISDKYPKAKHHFLVLPWKNIDTIYELTENDIELLEEMRILGLNAIEKTSFRKEDFKMGFHHDPSMRHLHLHVISNDFISDSLKKFKHWNIFNTDIFVPIESVIQELRQKGRIDVPAGEKIQRLMEAPLKCNKCDSQFNWLPDLKKHLLRHI
ncbi:aprataxin [Toxorhynchites rutilus septentrionalis]|uniref:aprataxin n=1 Tax=Toxorhynchites rutilus septentrionalis TaxID=329112 RepID=UPI00247A376E|nr:aprataxin [Toxorhynchites rutilus septentrionalis]XP_055629669.1 aprataxin [Toxorhynchites rutilus septentrionalis]